MKTIICGVDTPADYEPGHLLQVLDIHPMLIPYQFMMMIRGQLMKGRSQTLREIFRVIGARSVQEAGICCDRLYRMLFMPSFQPETCITVQVKPKCSHISLVTMQTNLWGYECYLRMRANGKWRSEDPIPPSPNRWEETQQVSSSLIADFLSQMDALQPEGTSDHIAFVVDGMAGQGEFFSAPDQYNCFYATLVRRSEQYQFAYVVYKLATDVLREEQSIRVLENIHGHLGLGLPVKNLGGNPYCVRIFGGLDSSYHDELENFLEGLPKSIPLLVDMSNFDGMGTLLYPVFQQFIKHRKRTPTTWWASSQAKRHLETLGVPSSSIFDTREGALAKLSK